MRGRLSGRERPASRHSGQDFPAPPSTPHILPGMDSGWMREAACLGAPLGLFVPDAEAPRPPPGVLAYCDRCPVADRCLAWALAWDEVGYWGGTSSRERRQLRRPRLRVGCPRGCGPHAVVPLGQAHQACLACAVSWPARRAG
jgi:WhiB family transcriptional regulator, redox-sensing transcriptional regulator